MTDNLERLKDWIGKTEFMEERASTGRAQGLAALLDKPDTPHEGEPMGLMDHWCFFKPRVRQSEAGPDNHSKRGGFMPPVPLPRRMFGGFRTTYHKPLILGEMMSKEAMIKAVQIKSGQTGTLVICTVSNRFSGESGLAIEEEHDFVYRDKPSKDAKDATATAANRLCAGRFRILACNHPGSRDAVPVIRLHFQRPPHSLRLQIRH